MLYSGGDENNITLVHGGVLSVREKKSLAFLAESDLVSVMVMQSRKGFGIGELDGGNVEKKCIARRRRKRCEMN